MTERRAILPAFQGVHELPWHIQALAHKARLMAHCIEGVAQQPYLVLRRRRSSHDGDLDLSRACLAASPGLSTSCLSLGVLVRDVRRRDKLDRALVFRDAACSCERRSRVSYSSGKERKAVNRILVLVVAKRDMPMQLQFVIIDRWHRRRGGGCRRKATGCKQSKKAGH